jgi:hypothetical protein
MPERMIDRTCEHCGKAFAVIPSRLRHGRGRHCSPACQYAAIRARPKPRRVTLTCIGCGQEFARAKSLTTGRKGAGKYCTRECRDKHWIGDKNPCWQNGDGVYKRGPRWHSIRRRVLARDGRACVECGSTERLHVHHVVPFRMFADEDRANHESNLVTLCAPCHRRAEAQFKWVRFESGAILRFAANSYMWQLAREKGLP